jgi:uncharacterized protein YuzE
MEIKYDPEADVLMIVLRDSVPMEAIEEPGGVIVSYGEDGNPVSVEFLKASEKRLILPGQASIAIQTAL